MKIKIGALLALAVVLLAVPASAQQATLSTPETVTATKVVVAQVEIYRDNASVLVEFRTAGEGVTRRASFGTSSLAELDSFIAAMGTTRSGETGVPRRRMQFRVLGWLVDNGKLKDEAGNTITVALVP